MKRGLLDQTLIKSHIRTFQIQVQPQKVKILVMCLIVLTFLDINKIHLISQNLTGETISNVMNWIKHTKL